MDALKILFSRIIISIEDIPQLNKVCLKIRSVDNRRRLAEPIVNESLDDILNVFSDRYIEVTFVTFEEEGE